jgi:hypothetical protein
MRRFAVPAAALLVAVASGGVVAAVAADKTGPQIVLTGQTATVVNAPAGTVKVKWYDASGADVYLGQSKVAPWSLTIPAGDKAIEARIEPAGLRLDYTVGGTPSPSPSSTPSPTLSPGPTPTSTPAPTPTATPTSSASPTTPARHPADVLDLANWKLQTATGGEIYPIGQTDTPPNFTVTSDGGVQFEAPVTGKPIGSSQYTRTELREVNPSGWGSDDGHVHSMVIREKVLHLPDVNPKAVVGQVLITGSVDFLQILAVGIGNGTMRLGVHFNHHEFATPLVASMPVGTTFTVRIIITAGKATVSVDGYQPLVFTGTATGLYFKAGMYPQSNVAKGEKPSAYGESVIYSLATSHI